MITGIFDQISVRISDEIKRKLYLYLVNVPGLDQMAKICAQRLSPVYLISFPKCGRTWLHVMIGKALQQHFAIEDPNILRIGEQKNRRIEFPGIAYIHDDAAHWKKAEELVTSKDYYRFKKVIFLTRDPRDVIVSLFFEKSKRLKAYLAREKEAYSDLAERIEPYEAQLHTYLQEEVGGFDTILKYYNIWAQNRHLPSKFLLVRYEDIHENPQRELRRVLTFLGIGTVSDQVISEAANFSSFNNMRAMERSDVYKNDLLRPTNKEDNDSYKTRKGEVGGFTNYLNSDEIRHLNSRMRESLSPYFRYETPQ